jgi:hypothetical protein
MVIRVEDRLAGYERETVLCEDWWFVSPGCRTGKVLRNLRLLAFLDAYAICHRESLVSRVMPYRLIQILDCHSTSRTQIQGDLALCNCHAKQIWFLQFS